MKKLFVALLTSSILFVPFAGADFSDVSSSHANSAAVDSLVDQDILLGYDDGTFRPEQAVTRGEAVKIMLLGMGVEVDEESIAGLLFEDVTDEDWFFSYVSTAVSMGILKGYDDGTFRPHQTVNRAEANKMLTLSAEVEIEDNGGEWFTPYEDYAMTWNLDPVQTDGLWHPEEEMSRANISELVYRMQNVQTSGIAFEESTNWQRRQFPTISMSMKVPFGWGTKSDGVGAAWLLDEGNGQLSLLSPYVNGGTLLMTRYSNYEGDDSTTLFNKVRSGTSVSNSQGTINGYPSLTVYTDDGENFRDWYLYVDNGSLVHLQGLRGEGHYGPYLEELFEEIINSVSFDDSVLTLEESVESLRSAIQVDGIGTEMMDLLSDWDLIETDALGVGTGPVDYFYSPSANITVKYERSFDVILDIQDGETTAF
ncbi:S-layer homology domain-containing protein [Candidatus Peregrinibacteria bacterium]|nr:S-layer homology domain-containing protein [Candidatus Peregrinibacteria bacterium]